MSVITCVTADDLIFDDVCPICGEEMRDDQTYCDDCLAATKDSLEILFEERFADVVSREVFFELCHDVSVDVCDEYAQKRRVEFQKSIARLKEVMGL